MVSSCKLRSKPANDSALFTLKGLLPALEKVVWYPGKGMKRKKGPLLCRVVIEDKTW